MSEDDDDARGNVNDGSGDNPSGSCCGSTD